MMVTAYCVKCRAKREITSAKEVTFKARGGRRRALQGKCSKCGTKVFRILGK